MKKLFKKLGELLYKWLSRKPEQSEVSPLNNNTKSIEKPKTKEDIFIEGLSVAVAKGYNAWCLYIQAYHETGAFKKIIGNYNYFGQKPPKSWTGKVLKVTTTEYIFGEKKEKVIDTFVDFETIEEAIEFHCSQIFRLYKDSHINRAEPIKYFYGLTNGKFQWGTDSQYSQKLETLYRNLYCNEEIKNKLSTIV